MSIAALWEAIRKNQVDAVERLLDSGMSVLATDEHPRPQTTAADLAALQPSFAQVADVSLTGDGVNLRR